MTSKISVIVQSTLSGKAAGFHTTSVSLENKVDDLIYAFCNNKGIPQKPHYILRTSKNLPLDSKQLIKAYKFIEDGETLFLGSKADEDSMFGFNNWWILAFLCVLIGGVGLVSVILVYCLDKPEDPINYAAVMDAGSTHTMTYLYNWNSEKEKGTAKVKQVTSCRGKAKGISSFANNPTSAGSSLSDCVKEIKKKIPLDEVKSTKVFLGATAGMRIMRLSNEATALKIMISVRDYLRISGLSYNSANIISGESEGEYAWITLNYLNKNFEAIKTKEPHHTVGSLDLGGASTQIAYESAGNSSISTQLFGEKYNIHSQSSLCFGMTQIRNRYLSLIIEDPLENTTSFNDPCSPKGHVTKVTSKKLFENVCTQRITFKNITKIISMDKTFTFHGQSDPDQCAERINGIFNDSICTSNFNSKTCFKEVPDFEHSKFLAISGFYSASSFLNITKVSLATYDKNVDAFCQKTWSDLKKYMPNKFLDKYCFDAKYIQHLLVDGYGFNSKFWPNIKFINQINGNDLGWALGYMLIKSNDIVGKMKQSPPISLLVLIILISLFVIFILLSVAFACHAIKQRKYQSSYQRSDNYKTLKNENYDTFSQNI